LLALQRLNIPVYFGQLQEQEHLAMPEFKILFILLQQLILLQEA